VAEQVKLIGKVAKAEVDEAFEKSVAATENKSKMI